MIITLSWVTDGGETDIDEVALRDVANKETFLFPLALSQTTSS